MAQRKQANKKSAGNNKRGPKAKQVEEEKPEMEVDASDDDSDADEEQNGVNFNDGSDSEAEGASEAEEAEDDDEEEDEDEDEDTVEPGEISKSAKSTGESDEEDDQDADSDEEPDEAPIGKQSKKAETPQKGGIPKVIVGRIPPETPKEQLLFVSNIPQEYKHIDMIALFAKFGPIAVVNRIKSKAGGNNLVIAFESAEAVNAALAAKEKALTLNDQVVNVSRPINKGDFSDRTVAVGLIGANATKEQISEHFKGCGAIEAINFSNNRLLPHAYVRFVSVSSVPKALKLHDSEFQSRFITVREDSYRNNDLKSPECTLIIANTGNYDHFKSETIEKIFKKHGEIIDLDTVCTKAVLGFVTYKTAEQSEKALKQLNGKTFGDLEIKVEAYRYSSSGRTIRVTNLAPGVEEEDLNELFKKAGEIESILKMPYRAVIKFTTDDAFCKSFLFNERMIKGQPIFLEPNSALKHKLTQKKNAHKPQQFYGKRAAPNASNAPPAKFKKFSNSNNNNTNQKNKPFNKRPEQGNGFTPKPFKKANKV
ncbi:DNA-binding protein modulo [Drosophila montana]|uniref:DNA-binding protein modulo n=1 Tax=Drosophila montana TaxID=40370 RepID=UPI00313D9D4E